MYKSANNAKRAEGCHPSTVERQASRRANGAALDRLTTPPKAPKPTRHAPRAPLERPSRAPAAPRAGSASPARPASPGQPPPRLWGNRTARARGPSGTVIGGVARTRGNISPAARQRVSVGDEVTNASGRGVWGKGTVVAVVPPDVAPWFWCKRRGLPLVFGRKCAPQFYERYIVLGDDGELHTPRRVAPAEGGAR